MLPLYLVKRFHRPFGDLFVPQLRMDQPRHQVLPHLQELLLDVLLGDVVWDRVYEDLVLAEHLFECLGSRSQQ